MDTVKEALGFLGNLKFNVRTDLAKGRINNRDAMAYLFYKVGPMRLSEVRDAMMMWRFGEASYTHIKCKDYDWHAKKERNVVRKIPKMGFSYAFNVSSSGGYGCVGDNVMTRGNWMTTGEGYCGIAHKQEHVKGKTFFRRTYWFRSGKGTYAPTLECMKRIQELGIG